MNCNFYIISLEQDDSRIKIKVIFLNVVMVYPGWIPDVHQSYSLTPSPQLGRGEKKPDKRLMGQEKDRERSLTNYGHR